MTWQRMQTSIIRHVLKLLAPGFVWNKETSQESKDITKKILNLKLITGRDDHASIPLPGFMMTFVGHDPLNAIKETVSERFNTMTRDAIDDELHFLYLGPYYDLIIRWYYAAPSSYYQLVYRNLFKTLGYADMSNLCRMNLPLPSLKQMAKMGFGITVRDDVESDALCTTIVQESNRRMLVKNGITENINQIDVAALILQPGSVWIMDAVGTTHLFKDTGGVLTQYPDAILPQTLTELTARYHEICANKEKRSKGEFIYIVEKLGHRLDLPANLAEIDKDQLCFIIERSLKERLAERDSHLTRNRLPSSYTLYREMCENRDRYPLNIYISAIVELGLEDDAKRRICTWLHSIGNMDARQQQHINFICDHMDQQRLDTVIGAARQYDRGESMLKEQMCMVITRWLDTVMQSHIRLGQ
jgi:hypothetical protein